MAQDILHDTRRLPAEAQDALLRPLAQAGAPGANAHSARQLLHSESWKQGSARDRLQLAQVFGAADAPGLNRPPLGPLDPRGALDSLVKLARSPERLLRSQDAQGGNLLSNLATLATGPLHPSIDPARRGKLLAGVLQETATAGQVDQHSFSTCTVTSMQYELARDTPAEYARIMAGLAGPSGRVALRGGGELELQPDSLPRAALQGRSLSEALFQSAAMEFANGEDDYSVNGGPDGSDISRRPDGTQYAGQHDSGEVRLLQALFARPYSAWSGTTPSDAAAQLDFLRNYQPRGPNSPVLLNLFTQANRQGAHAVDFVRVEGDRVFFRNPWGPQGEVGQDAFPGARVENPRTGLNSISIAQFQQLVYQVIVPEEARAYGAPAAA